MISFYESATQRVEEIRQNPTDSAMTGAPLSVGTALLAAMLLVMVPQFSSASTEECDDQWKQSDAYDTCQSTDVEYVQGSDPKECSITADCSVPYTMHIEGEDVTLTATITATTQVQLDKVKDLKMCVSNPFNEYTGTVSLSTSCD